MSCIAVQYQPDPVYCFQCTAHYVVSGLLVPDTVVSASILRSFQHQLKTFFYFNDPLIISTVID